MLSAVMRRARKVPMRSRRFLLLLATSGVVLTLARPAAMANDLLAGLGSTNFTVLVATGDYGQSTTNLTLISPFALGELVGGQFASVYDWSGVSSFGLLMSAPGESPNATFSVEFFDEQLTQIVNTYQGSASDLTTTPSFVSLNLSLPGTGDLSSVGGLQFTWDSPGSGDVLVTGVVPEPGTWALFGMGVGMTGWFLARQRARGRQ